MSLTNAMMTGFTGVKSNSVAVDTVGDNLANINTTAFKGQRTLFETLMYRNISEGSGPTATSGGSLPRQVGTGSTVASVQRNFRQGGLESTGFQSDLAIEGDGFFVIERPNGDTAYTRDGAFRLDADQTLVNANESAVQVFAANEDGTINTGSLIDLTIPLGTASQAIATTRVEMDGRLDAGANLAGEGATAVSSPLVTDGGTAASASTSLASLVDAQGLPLFSDGDVLRLNATKGGLAVSSSTFTVGANGSTVGDLTRHMQDWLGIDTSGTTDPAPGVSISDGTDHPAGSIVVHSNPGEANAIELTASSIANTSGVVASPVSFATEVPATGRGVTTSFSVYDSLGNPLEVRLRTALESKSDTGTTWRFYAESVGDSDATPLLGSGTVSFDANGQFVSSTGTDITVDRAGQGSTTPLALTLDMSQLTGLASLDGTSELIMASQDGAPAGILTGYTIDSDGMVTGTYSNQRTQVLGQIALATFTNNEGLLAISENTFVPGPNSGSPDVIAPQTGTAGSIISGALEGGNVELAREFVNLITASTGISAAGRVVRSADDLLQQLLQLVR